MAKGSLRDKARRDFKKFSQSDFSSEITFIKTPENIIVDGIVSKHNLSIDPDTGVPVNSSNAHITISEQVLNDAGIVTRDVNKKVIVKGMKISFADASGLSFTYMIDEAFTSDTLGVIVCIVGIWQS